MTLYLLYKRRRKKIKKKQYSQKSQSERHIYCIHIRHIRWQCSFHHPWLIGLQKIVIPMRSLFIEICTERIKVCGFTGIFKRYSEEEYDLLSRNIAGVDISVYRLSLEKKHSSMEWRYIAWSVSTKFSVPPAAGKLRATVFFRS